MSLTPYPTLRLKLTVPQALKLQFLPAVPGSNAAASAAAAQAAADAAQSAANTATAATANKVDKSGDVMTGFLTLNANPNTNLQAATKQYVDGAVSTGGIPEAPSDGSLYGRMNAAWAQAQPFDADLTSIASATVTNQWLYRSAANVWSPVTLGATLSFSGGVLNTTAGGGNVIASGTPINGQWARWTSAATIEGVDAANTGFQPLDGDLTALAAATGIGVIYYRSAANTWLAVQISTGLNFTSGILTATASGGNVSNSGTPTVGQYAKWLTATTIQGVSTATVLSDIGAAPVGAEYITSTADATLTAERVLTDTATVTWDRTTAGQIKANAASGAPVGATYITSTADATLTAERVLTDTATVTWDRTTAGQIKANAGGGSPAVGFRAWKNGVNQTGIANITWTKVTFPTEEFDQGSFYDPATSRWTPSAGLIHIDARVGHASGIADQSNIWVAIYKNGVELKRGGSVTASALASAGGAINIDDVANGSDYYEVWTYANGVASTWTIDGAFFTVFDGHICSAQGPAGPAGVAGGQPLDADLTALSNLTGTNNIYYRSAPDTWTAVGIGPNMSFAAGTLDAVAGGAGFGAGTVMLFQQTAAPTGWTKLTTHNDKALRVVSGTVGSGGNLAFSTVFGRTNTDAHVLTIAEMPSHLHTFPANAAGTISSGVTTQAGADYGTPVTEISQTTGTGSDIGHTHPMDIRVQYVDCIIASKN